MIIFAVIILIYLMANNGKNEEILIGISPFINGSEYNENIQGFKDGLAEEGYIDGENIRYIEENPEGNMEKQFKIVDSFVKNEADLIYTLTTTGTLAAHNIVPNEIPMVFSIVLYPVEAGLIKSFESSGNHHVGTSKYISSAKQYELFEKIYPDAKRIAFVHRRGETNSIIQYREFKTLFNSKGIEILDIEAYDLRNMRKQLEENIDSVDALYSSCDTLIQSGGEDIVIEFGKKYKIPVFTCNRDGVLKGALMGVVADTYEMGKSAGKKAGRILKGAKPSSIPSELPKENIFINLNTANELGLQIPEDLIKEAETMVD